LEVNVRLGDVLACLDDLEEFVCEPYRHSGAGRPPRSPPGILKALIVKRFRIFQATMNCIGVYGGVLSLGAYATLRIMRSLIILPSYAILESV
jgi:hypothetical protein